mgnify:CR=1 FL=1
MYKIATLNKISPVGLKRLTDKYTITENIDEANGILVRSAAMHDLEFDEDLKESAKKKAYDLFV